MMQIIKLNDMARKPWLNGGGVTRDLWVGPSVVDWQWRISVATVDSDGPFSSYPGVTRHFAVLQGNGVRLRFADGEREVHASSDAVQFDGADAPHCTLINGPSLDLNLLVRREAGTGSMERVVPGKAWRSPARRRAVWCGSAATIQIEGLPPCKVPAGALACIDHASGKGWSMDIVDKPASAAWWIAIESPAR